MHVIKHVGTGVFSQLDQRRDHGRVIAAQRQYSRPGEHGFTQNRQGFGVVSRGNSSQVAINAAAELHVVEAFGDRLHQRFNIIRHDSAQTG